MTEAILFTDNLSRHYGGIAANSQVSITLRRGQLHAVLGPNGAGKTTLINLLSGDVAASHGSIRFGDQEISGFSAHRRSRIGIGRSYQKTNIFPSFTVFENTRLAAQSRQPRPFKIFSSALSYKEIVDTALSALERTGLSDRRDDVASTLSHGEQRQLEIAMVLATRPDVLLLDEPLAGMGSEESAQMVQLLKQLSPHHAILIVEHDMDAVFAIADVITVMVNGQVLEHGPPRQIRSSVAVQQAYLGHEDDP
ncbi:MAG: ABC transporter ATP-binding protein [Gammaproteobacteria bacterium]|nr:ABC transporter ATP-binding protein [Gammaproteobacteria bacterium]MCP5458389.1 ABC transporter ATP-binding protein [Gammaproteobacteria bacterium]